MMKLRLLNIHLILTKLNSNEIKDKTDTFKILSLNCQSINAKFDQLIIKLKQLSCGGI